MSSSATASFFFSATSAAHELSLAHPRSNGGQPYFYGTSGFRGLASTLPSITVRIGFLAALRSLSFRPHPLTVGVMVTASHNDAPDNGVKLVDPSGAMLTSSWETSATELANVSEADVGAWLKAFALRERIELGRPAKVFVGRDTRDSSPSLCALVVEGVHALGGEVEDFGVVTTPLLHWAVQRRNDGADCSADCYYRTLAAAFSSALQGKDGTTGDAIHLAPLTVDCANGVGASALQRFKPLVPALPLSLINTASTSHLNEHCGAEHVQKTRSLPSTASSPSPPSPPEPGQRLASLDGDADRLVYYYLDGQRVLRLLDGDKLLALYITFVSRLLKDADVSASVGIVQTAYANGASTRYMREVLKVEPLCTATGVKHLHHVAAEYDVGLYFEANGHGTVLFKPTTVARFKDAAERSKDERQRRGFPSARTPPHHCAIVHGAH